MVWDSLRKNDSDEPGVISEVKSRLEIPGAVWLNTTQDCFTYGLSDIAPFIKHWVGGTLTENEASSMLFAFTECGEFDFGWVFMERPCGYYGMSRFIDVDGDLAKCEEAEICREFLSIGTRSKRKHSGNTFNEAFKSYCFGM